LTKYQENITNKEVTLFKILSIFRDFQELRFREVGILNRENQILKINKISGERNE